MTIIRDLIKKSVVANKRQCSYYVRILLDCQIVSSGKPYFESTDKLEVADVSRSSVTVRWPEAKDKSSGLEKHYYYIVWLQGDGETQTSGSRRLESRVTGLKSNTLYTIKIVPYRQQNDLHESIKGRTKSGSKLFPRVGRYYSI